MPSKKGKASSVNIGLNIGGKVRLKKVQLLKNSILSILQWLIEELTKSVNKFGRQFVKKYQHKGVLSNSYSFSMVSENKIF